MDLKLISILAAALAVSIGSIGPALAEGRSVAAAMDAIARQPEAAGTISRTLFVGLAMIETMAIYCLVVALLAPLCQSVCRVTMHFDWSTFALQTVNFAVLVWLLHRFLYRPVLADDRRAPRRDRQAVCRSQGGRRPRRRSSFRPSRPSAPASRPNGGGAEGSGGSGGRKPAARRAQAEHDAAALLDGARKTSASERDRALAEARRAALDLGAEIARRLLAESADETARRGVARAHRAIPRRASEAGSGCPCPAAREASCRSRS